MSVLADEVVRRDVPLRREDALKEAAVFWFDGMLDPSNVFRFGKGMR